MMAGMVIGTWSGTIAALVVLFRRDKAWPDKACLVSTVAAAATVVKPANAAATAAEPANERGRSWAPSVLTNR